MKGSEINVTSKAQEAKERMHPEQNRDFGEVSGRNGPSLDPSMKQDLMGMDRTAVLGETAAPAELGQMEPGSIEPKTVEKDLKAEAQKIGSLQEAWAFAYENYDPYHEYASREPRIETGVYETGNGEMKEYTIPIDHYGNPDFGEHVLSSVKSPIYDSRIRTFGAADRKQAELWNAEGKDGRTDWTAQDIKSFRKDNGYVWHEKADLCTLELVPMKLHDLIPHFGGHSIAVFLVNQGTDLEGLHAKETENE